MSQPTRKKPRAKKAATWSDPMVKQQFDNSRRELAREAADRAERQKQQGRLALSRVRDRAEVVPKNKTAAAVVRGLGSRFSAVTRSWGLDLALNWSQNDSPKATNVSGQTDFTSITLEYPSVPIQKALTEGDIETLDTYLLSLRGVYYHEVGHNLYTLPLGELVGRGQRGLDNKHQRKFSDLTVSANQRQHYGNRYPGVRHAWNVMEDQRMEYLLTQESPNIAAYLTVKILTDHAGDPAVWGMISGRHYLSDRVRDAARAEWDAHFGSKVTSDEVADVTHRYITAGTEAEALAAVIDMQEIMNKLALDGGDDSHDDQEQGNNANTFQKTKPQNTPPKPSKPSKPSKSDDQGEQGQSGQQGQSKDQGDQNSDSGDESGEGQDGQGEGEDSGEGQGQDGEGESDDSQGGEGDGNDSKDGQGQGQGEGQGEGSGQSQGQSGGQSPQSGGQSAGTSGTGQHGSLNDEAREAVREATQNATSTSTHQADRQATNETFNSADGKLGQYENIYGKDTNPENQQTAARLIVDMEKAFETATANDAPVWVSGERRGILEPVRYRTRTPGDMEYYRAYSDRGEQNVDLEVSCIFDVSGSMGYSMEALAVSAYATQQACHNLGIRSQVVLYDTEAYSLYEPGEDPGALPSLSSAGGTNPVSAFDAVLSEESESATHIVVIMTDGEWSDGYNLGKWRQDNTYVCVFCYGNFDQDRMSSRFNEADEVIVSDNLLDLPIAIEKLIVQAVS